MRDPAERWRRLTLACCLLAFVVILAVVYFTIGPAR